MPYQSSVLYFLTYCCMDLLLSLTVVYLSLFSCAKMTQWTTICAKVRCLGACTWRPLPILLVLCINLVHLVHKPSPSLPLLPLYAAQSSCLYGGDWQRMSTPRYPSLPLLLPILCLLLSPTLITAAHNYRASGCNGASDKPKLYIQGFVPANSAVFTSETIVPAASVACREVNSNQSVLSDYELVIEWSDTEVRGSVQSHGGNHKAASLHLKVGKYINTWCESTPLPWLPLFNCCPSAS